MHIEPDEEIGGFSTIEVRRLMRKAVGRSITVRYVREALDCSASDASRVLHHLQKAGFVESVGSHLGPLQKEVRSRSRLPPDLSVAKQLHASFQTSSSEPVP